MERLILFFLACLVVGLAFGSSSLKYRYELLEAIDEKLGRKNAHKKEFIVHYSMPNQWLEVLKDLGRNFLQPLLKDRKQAPWSTIYDMGIEEHINQWLCPENFFFLDNINVKFEVKKEIFRLLSLKEISDSISTDSDKPPETAVDLQAVVKNLQKVLCKMIFEKYDIELVKILAEIPDLNTSFVLEKTEKDQNYKKRSNVIILRAIVYRRLMEATKGGSSLDTICPDGFFDVKREIGVDVEEGRRKRIFSLLTIDEILNSLIKYGFQGQEKQGMKEFINKNDKCMYNLCNQVTLSHWDDLGSILADIPELKALSRFMRENIYRNYSTLIERIYKAKVYKKLMKATKDGSDLDDILPNGFFDLKKETGLDIGKQIRIQIFKLLTIKKIVDSLVSSGFHKEKKQGIKEFIITNNVCVESLCNKVTLDYWEELGNILAESLGLKELSRLMKSASLHYYSNLLDCISQAILIAKILKDVGKDIGSVWRAEDI